MPALQRSWIGPKQFQFAFLPIGVIPDVWSCITFFNTFFQHANDGAAPLEVRCIADSPLLQCLLLHRGDCAAQLLHALYKLHTPALISALEFSFHSALNHGSPALLQDTLHQLASLPLFPFVLIDCLRKQERSTWQKVLHNPADVLFLFRRFLNAGYTRFAMAVISVLQGVDCSASEFALPPPPYDQLYIWCDQEAVQNHTWPEFHFLLDVCSQVWSEQDVSEAGEEGTVNESDAPQNIKEATQTEKGRIEEECVAHKAGLELLLVMLMRKEYDSLSDVYRFVLMEENRHAELNHFIPQQFQVDVVLTQCALALLQKGHLTAMLALTKAIHFQWVERIMTPVANFGEAVNVILNRTDLPLPPFEVFSEFELFQEMIPRCGHFCTE